MKPSSLRVDARGDPRARVLDPAFMLDVFRRELPRLTDTAIHVSRCSAKAVRSRSAARARELRIAYRVGVERAGVDEREYVLLATAPAESGFPSSALRETCRALVGHPETRPFHTLAAYLAELELGLRFFPVDPAFPALAELTGPAAAGLLEGALREVLAGQSITRVRSSLRRYKPFHRAVLEVTAELAGSGVAAGTHTFFVKLFADERGQANHRELAWLVARERESLELPSPLHYDSARRMLVLSAAPGERRLSAWIKCLEDGVPLPEGVDLARVERCVGRAARALGELQRCGLRPALQRTFADELAALRKDARLLDGNGSTLSTSVARVLERLVALTPRAERLAPSHGGLSHKELFGDERRLTIIDWDGLCAASPALDAATFLQRLRREPLLGTSGASHMARVAEHFRRAFLELQPQVTESELALYEALVLAGGAVRSLRGASAAETPAHEVEVQLAAAERMLEQARSAT